MKRFLTSVRLQHEPKVSDVITLVKKTFFARVSYEILYHEVWNKILKIVRVMVRVVFKKRVSRKTRLKFWVLFIAQVAVWEMPDTPQEKREIRQKKKFMYVTFCLIF